MTKRKDSAQFEQDVLNLGTAGITKKSIK